MSKKLMKIPSLFKNRGDPKHHPWQWPSCKHPKTHSFRAGGETMFRTVNSVFLDGVDTPESLFTNSSESASCWMELEELCSGEESLEMIVRGGARAERLFFEPRGGTSSILEAAKAGGESPFGESVMLAMESEDPYGDFRRSMEEMVECHGLKDWEYLEQLLGCYLRMNGRNNHGFIVGAFIDLLFGLSSSSDAGSASSFSTAVSSLSSPLSAASSSSFGGQKESSVKEKMVVMPEPM
ncbi:transcription repressor OFP13 [Malania oleifera]|uniref:transcription repressor OFP13 n=1 Tax=Malania oleifera TaxID=397392 RepID=UPI0025AE832A|nr:transcription repressor OFP13 [Malania oleifera]